MQSEEEKNEYLVIVQLLDGVEFQIPKKYNWGSDYVDKLNDLRDEFIEIENIVFKKSVIKTIQVIENPNYNKESEEN